MNVIAQKPYQILWLTIPLIFILFFFSNLNMNSAIDIQMHDAYFVISAFHIAIFLSIVLGLLGSIYFLVRKRKLVSWMTVIHILTTVFLFVLLALQWVIPPLRLPIDYHFSMLEIVNNVIFILFLAFFVGQVLFILNLVFSFSKIR